jgi:hypothetical protein
MFRQVSEEVAKACMAIYGDPARWAAYLPRLFQPKGKMDLDALVVLLGIKHTPAVCATILHQ